MAQKRKNTKNLIVIFTVAVLLICFARAEKLFGDEIYEKTGLRDSFADGMMTVSFIDVGQADCTLITCGDAAILVDGGEAGTSQTVINFLRQHEIDSIDCCIATHPHADHIGGLPDIINEFEIGDVIMPEIPRRIIPTTTVYKNFLQAVSEKAENIIPAEAGETYSYGELTVEILAPVGEYDDLNNMSVAAKITYGKTSLMLTGDAEEPAEFDMLENSSANYSAQLMKAGHHGSQTSSSDEWLDAVNPQAVVISCGADNSYGHPHKQLLKRLENREIKYYRTDLLGTIIFQSDGRSFQCVDNEKIDK